MKNNLSLISFLAYLFSTCSINQVEAKNNIQKQQRNISNWITYIEKKSKKKIYYTYSNPIKYSFTVYSRDNLSQEHPVTTVIDEYRKDNLNNSYNNYAKTYNLDQNTSLINLLIQTTINYCAIKSYENNKNYTLDYYSLSGLK